MPLGKSSSFVQPYISAAAGVSVVDFRQYLGEFGGNDNSANFMAQAGAGILIPFSHTSAAGIKLGANFNYINYSKNGFSNLNNVDFLAGVYIPLR
jgi:hypothetical protein